MLTEYRKIFEEDANARLPEGWRKLDNNDIWRKCTEDYKVRNKEVNFNSPWFSALTVKYWSCMDGLYNKSKPFFNETDVYSWYIDSLIYTLDKHVWEDPENKLYQDDRGPDKAFHVHLPCVRITAFQQANTFKRKANATYYNTEDYGDYSETINEEEGFELFDKSMHDFQQKTLIVELFNRKDYFQAFLLDGILCYNMFVMDNDTNEVEFDKPALVRHLKRFNDFNCERFAETYELDFTKVKEIAHYVTDLPVKSISQRIDNMLFIYKKENFVEENIQNV